MKRIVCIALACSALALSSAHAADVVVGGQPMLPGKTIVANALNSADHTTLVAAVKAAGLVDTLQGKGPFTVFAPPTPRSANCRQAPWTRWSSPRTRPR